VCERMLMEQFEKRPFTTDPIEKDILSGMDESSLKLKHGLSDEELRLAYRRCSDRKASNAHGKSATWTCPACGVPQPRAMEECPRCGIVVSKFSDRRRIDSDCRPIRTNRPTASDESSATTWITVAGSVILCLFLGGALLKWAVGNRQEGIKLSEGPGQVSTGLKRFTVENLQDEVVAVSRNQPVIIEFYSSN
jgi:hypothetical protein